MPLLATTLPYSPHTSATPAAPFDPAFPPPAPPARSTTHARFANQPPQNKIEKCLAGSGPVNVEQGASEGSKEHQIHPQH